jgi:glycerol kinase
VNGLVLGLDQGTSSTRCVAVDPELRERGACSIPVTCSYPGPGLVEQSPDELADSAARAIAGCLEAAGGGEVLALGIANQTETFVVWDRATGRPVHPAIVWQDRRTDAACEALGEHAGFVRARTGLALDATFPATKLRRVLDTVGSDDGLAYGDVASWLLQALAGVWTCDAGNAGRSLLCPLGGTDWDDQLLELFGVPRSVLPPIVDTDAIHATIRGAPVRAALGDQQASLFGLRCTEPGAAKVTLGTGAFVLACAGGTAPAPPAGVRASCAWRRSGVTTYALEGFVPAAGAAIDWFARELALPAGPGLDALLREGRPGPSCVPALAGFGTPTWNAAARGAILGIGLDTTRADLARAVVDGILHQIVDALGAIGVGTLWVDGGLSRSDWIVQRLADLGDVRVQRTPRADSTALGAAMLAGLAAGVWSTTAEIPRVAADLVAEPRECDREAERARWAAAVELARSAPSGRARS